MDSGVCNILLNRSTGGKRTCIPYLKREMGALIRNGRFLKHDGVVLTFMYTLDLEHLPSVVHLIIA